MSTIYNKLKQVALKSILKTLPLRGVGLGLLVGLLLGVSSCIKEVTPTDVVSESQIKSMSDTQESLLYGISAFMVTKDTWGGGTYYLNDWGFPCQVYFREINGEDFPIYKSTYDYWTYHENGTYASSYTIYTWYFYYSLIRNCNDLIGVIDESSASTASKRILGSALAFRAMAYMDLARSFEFKPTGVSKLDEKANANGLWGLTVPIVTENTTTADGTNNPRADYCKMWRFIMTDLRKAKELLGSYNPEDCSLPGTDAVNGLMARAWLEIGSRMDENTTYINGYTQKFIDSDNSGDGYTKLGVSTSKECYKNASQCAQNAIGTRTPVTEAQWHDATTGFNTANQAWIWRCRIGTEEQEPAYYCSFIGSIASEPEAGLPYSYDAYRCISDSLYKLIDNNDWRKYTWMDPADATKGTDAMVTKYKSNLSATSLKKIPAYANFKFRPGNGNTTNYKEWLISDLPVMRMEEMYFIWAEAEARANNSPTDGQDILKRLLNNRYTNGIYTANTTQSNNVDNFVKYELMIQKRIEFWGEGICFFDYKRLNLRVNRADVSNYESAFKLVSIENRTAPWMNYYIPEAEIQRNAACKANPDVSGTYTQE